MGLQFIKRIQNSIRISPRGGPLWGGGCTMARVSVEDCLHQVPNRFALIHLATKRVRQLERGAKRLVGSKNKNIVEALREIAACHVRAEKDETEED